MHMSEESRKQLRHANTLARGWITVAKQAETIEARNEALSKALLLYDVWCANEV